MTIKEQADTAAGAGEELDEIGRRHVRMYVRTSSGVRFSKAIEVLLCTYLFLYLGERLIT